ncbi:PTS sugar transporter subunit IIA [Liquorilactobacillus ghanensis]|uniref:PTS sugar transporter subunit IIA n=1 Tax=Liquorilactobacillus ghanensis TaxID=399370 RepID=UPI0039EA704E
MTRLFSLNHIFLNQNLVTKDQVFRYLAQKAVELSLGEDDKLIFDAFQQRELQSSTGMQNGIAMPHAISADILQPGVIYISLSKSINDWVTFDDTKVNKVVALLAPKDEVKQHLETLSEFASSLIDDEKRQSLDKCKTASEVFNLLKLGGD